jgi:hypothetical protein
LELARRGVPKVPFYLTGQAGGQPFSVHAEGERVILTSADGRREVDLLPPGAPSSPAVDAGASSLPAPVCPQGVVSASGDGFEDPPGPGESALDAALERIADFEPMVDLEQIPDLPITERNDARAEGGAS